MYSFILIFIRHIYVGVTFGYIFVSELVHFYVVENFARKT